MFLPNKYTKLYFQIIESARVKIYNGYTETHHIIPKCLGGSNNKENLITFSAREHFLCHFLLPKMLEYRSQEYFKMLHAFILMKGMNKNQIRYINSKLYESYKKEYSLHRKNQTKG